MFFYAFNTIGGEQRRGHKVTKSNFDDTKMDDTKYIKKFLKKNSRTFMNSCKIISCEPDCEWFVKITVDLTGADINDLLNKEIDILTLNSLVHNTNKEKYENLFDCDGFTRNKLRDEYYEAGYISYKDNTKIEFEKIENGAIPYLVKVTNIQSE